MTRKQNRVLLDFYSLSIMGNIEEREIKDEIQKASIEMDRAFVKGESTSDIEEYYNELWKLLGIFNMPA
jgi:hypothetical protein